MCLPQGWASCPSTQSAQSFFLAQTNHSVVGRLASRLPFTFRLARKQTTNNQRTNQPTNKQTSSSGWPASHESVVFTAAALFLRFLFMALLTRFPSFSGRLRRHSQSSIILQFTWSRKRRHIRCIRLFEFIHGDGFESLGHSECGKWMDAARNAFQVSNFRLVIEFPVKISIFSWNLHKYAF